MKKRMLAILLAASLVAGTGWGNGFAYAAPEIQDKETEQEVAPEKSENLEQLKEVPEVEKQQSTLLEEVESNDEKEVQTAEPESNSEEKVQVEKVEETEQELSVEEDTKAEIQESGKDATETEQQPDVMTEEVGLDGSSDVVKINVNSVKEDTLRDSYDKDHLYYYDYAKEYSFTVGSAGVISLSFGKGYDSNTKHRWRLTLYDENGAFMMGSTYYCGNTDTETSCKIGVAPGTYSIIVGSEDYYKSDAFYSLKVNYTASSVWESESNDSIRSADQIGLNQLYYGGIMDVDDEDYYRFQINSPGVISLSFGKGYDRNTDHGWQLYLYDENVLDGNADPMISRYYSCGNTDTETSCKIGVSAGTYYVKVFTSNDRQSDAAYNLKVNYSAGGNWEREDNGGTVQANPIAIGTWYNGSIMDSDDKDYYRFTLSQASYVNISAKGNVSDTGYTWDFCLYDSSWNELQENNYDRGKTTVENYGIVRLPAGTYYLRVSGYQSNATYSIRINTTFTKTDTMLSAKNTDSGIKLSWNRIPEGSGYKVYRRTGNGSSSLIKTIENNKTTSFTDKSVKKKNGTKYTYWVQAYKGSQQNKCLGKVIYRLTAPAKPEVKNSKGKKINVKWKKNNSASGYQVKFVNGSNTRTKTFSGRKSVKKTVSGFKKGKTYKVYVRSYKQVSNQKYYSPWSAAKSIKVKK